MDYRWIGNEGQDGWRARTGRQRRGGDCGDPEQSLASTGVSVSQTSHGPSSHVPGRTRARTDSGGAILSGLQRWDGRRSARTDTLHVKV